MNKILRNFSQLLPVWVILAGVLGYFYPAFYLLWRNYNEWFFALTMVGVGAVLHPQDFRFIRRQPQIVFLGTLAQFLIMPALGFSIGYLLGLPRDLRLGLIVVGAVPGAMASNVISYLAGADAAYSISLTTSSTLLAPVLTPFFTYLFARTLVPVPVASMFFSIFKMVVIPLLVGFSLRSIFPTAIEEIKEIFPAVSVIFISFICGLVVALNRDSFGQINWLIFAAIVLHNFFGLFFGYLAGLLYRLDIRRVRTLAIEVGMQNAGLGAVLSLKYFTELTALPNALFATWCVITASLLVVIWRRN